MRSFGFEQWQTQHIPRSEELSWDGIRGTASVDSSGSRTLPPALRRSSCLLALFFFTVVTSVLAFSTPCSLLCALVWPPFWTRFMKGDMALSGRKLLSAWMSKMLPVEGRDGDPLEDRSGRVSRGAILPTIRWQDMHWAEAPTTRASEAESLRTRKSMVNGLSSSLKKRMKWIACSGHVGTSRWSSSIVLLNFTFARTLPLGPAPEDGATCA
mmetsp:Transcript_83947/g.237846  ORF Transcript_83947/g.237846 Transcript_83947/m.237846 type:complete len:212 (-) Transcript_83947:1837-2472(-)